MSSRCFKKGTLKERKKKTIFESWCAGVTCMMKLKSAGEPARAPMVGEVSARTQHMIVDTPT